MRNESQKFKFELCVKDMQKCLGREGDCLRQILLEQKPIWIDSNQRKWKWEAWSSPGAVAGKQSLPPGSGLHLLAPSGSSVLTSLLSSVPRTLISAPPPPVPSEVFSIISLVQSSVPTPRNSSPLVQHRERVGGTSPTSLKAGSGIVTGRRDWLASVANYIIRFLILTQSFIPENTCMSFKKLTAGFCLLIFNVATNFTSENHLQYSFPVLSFSNFNMKVLLVS